MPHVVHTFNVDHSKQGTVEDLPDRAARKLISTGRARLATDDEISAGRAAEPKPADDQMPESVTTPDVQTPAPAPTPVTLATDPGTEAQPEPKTPEAAPQPAGDGKVTAVPKAGKPAGAVATTPAPPPAK